MAAAEEHTRSGLSRRDALRLLAASTGTVAATSAIVSQPALAANGSQGCVYAFGSDPQVTVQAANQPGGQKDVLSISVSPIAGRCPCEGGTARVEYAYHIVTRSSAGGTITASGGTGWRAGWNAVSVVSPTVLWPNGGGNPNGVVTVAVGVRVTCPVKSGDTSVCRSATGSFNITNPSGSLNQTFALGTDSTASPLPACGSSAVGRSAAPLIDSAGSVVFTPGKQTMPTLDSTIDEPAVDLGPVEPVPDTAESTTTTSTTTTTTTTTSVPAPSESSTSTTSTSSTPTQPLDE